MAYTIVISWNENLEPNIAFYKAYWGSASGVYTAPGSPKNLGNALSGTIDIPTDGDWFVALTVVNTSNQESDWSTEIKTTVRVPRGAVRGR